MDRLPRIGLLIVLLFCLLGISPAQLHFKNPGDTREPKWGGFGGGVQGAGGGGCVTPIAQIEVLEASGAPAGDGTITINLGSNTAAGELIVVVVFRPYNMGITSISDDKSQAYTALWSNVLVGGQNRTWFYYVLNSVADVSSVTITLPDTDERGGCFVGRYTGVATSDAIDQGDYADSSAGGSPWSSDSVTTTTAKDLLIGIMGATLTSWGGTNGIPSASGSWTQDQWMGGASVQYIDGGNGAMFAYAHQIISSTGDYSNAGTTASDTTTFDHYGFIVAFKGLCQ